MYKIRQLLLWLLIISPPQLFGQSKKIPVSAPRNQSATRQSGLLQSGPMVGYSEMREVMLWVQTKKPARVQIRYHEVDKPTPVQVTNEVQTNRQTVFTAHLLADLVEPGKKYAYDVLIEGQKVSLPYPTQFQTQSLWQWRTDPPPFRFAVGSCTYVNEPEVDRPGKPYGGSELS